MAPVFTQIYNKIWNKLYPMIIPILIRFTQIFEIGNEGGFPRCYNLVSLIYEIIFSHFRAFFNPMNTNRQIFRVIEGRKEWHWGKTISSSHSVTEKIFQKKGKAIHPPIKRKIYSAQKFVSAGLWWWFGNVNSWPLKTGRNVPNVCLELVLNI